MTDTPMLEEMKAAREAAVRMLNEPPAPRFTFSFRAECHGDAAGFLSALEYALNDKADTFEGPVDYVVSFQRNHHGCISEPLVEINSNVDLYQFALSVMRSLDDSHVMIQTARPCEAANNSFARDYDKN